MTESNDNTRSMKRRGILAAAGAVVAGIVAKQTAQPVAAVSGGGADGMLVLGSNFGNSPNTAGQTTILQRSGGTVATPLLYVDGFSVGGNFTDNIDGIVGRGSGAGTGVQGIGGPSGGMGVFGNGFVNGSSGVVGTTTSVTPGTAGGYFYTATTNASGVVGQVFAASGAAAFVGAAVAPNYAGFFTGTVVINGKLVVTDPSYKSGALLHPDGTHRLVYCVESPESWIEDVGTGTLAGGKATVTFDTDFTAVTHTDTYHVFLTPYGSSGALRVAARRGDGFTVEEIGGTSSGTFSWKVMVKAKSSVKAERLGKFTMPTITVPDKPPLLPDLPTAPAKKA